MAIFSPPFDFTNTPQNTIHRNTLMVHRRRRLVCPRGGVFDEYVDGGVVEGESNRGDAGDFGR
jgi:hypothetical protein